MPDKVSRALKAAAQDPQYRNDFYQTLLESQLYLLATANPQVFGEISGVLENEVLPVIYTNRPDGSTLIPVYSSRSLLQQVHGKDEQVVKLPARTVFELTKGSHLALNPGTEAAKELFPGEIDSLLSGAIFEEQVEEEEPPVEIRYVILLTPGPNWEQGTDVREQPGIMEHIRHYAALNAEGKLSLGGLYLDPDRGGMMVPPPGLSREEVEAYAAADPAVRSGLLKFEVVEWLVAMRGKG